MSSDIITANRVSCVIASQIKAFAETLPSDKQAAIVLGEKVIEIREVISLENIGLIVLQGYCRDGASPLYRGAPFRVVLEPILQGLTLIGVPRRATEPRQPIGFSIQAT